MKLLSFIAVAALMQAQAAWAADPCESQNSTLEINACAKKKFDDQDQLLNAAYKNALDVTSTASPLEIGGESPRSLLNEAQRRWLEFRDADCKAMYQVFAGGTARHAIYLDCMRDRTEKRTKELDPVHWRGG